jgi:hypothetical protein
LMAAQPLPKRAHFLLSLNESRKNKICAALAKLRGARIDDYP